MSEIQSNKKVIIAFIFIGIVVIGFGVYGAGKIIQNITNNNPEGEGDNNEEEEEEEEQEVQIFHTFNQTYYMNITDIDDNVFQLDDSREYFVILYFYTLQCGYCRYHAPNLFNVSQNYTSDELVVISISISSLDNPAKVQGYADSQGFTWPLVSGDYGGQYASPYNLVGVPTTVYIGTNDIMRIGIGADSVEGIQEKIDSVNNYSESSSTVNDNKKTSCKLE